MDASDLSITEAAALAGVSSRTLRHYGAVGLLPATRVAANGYRHYGPEALVRLQRILLLRELGLGLDAIAQVLGRETTPAAALAAHVGWLRAEQDRLARQLASVEKTMAALNEGVDIMASTMFDGFDHTQYKDEVEARWGKKAYADGDAWWRGLPSAEKAAWKGRVAALNDAWRQAFDAGTAPDAPEAQDLARRHVAWLTSVPGTPAHDGGNVRAYVLGLAGMYVADARFAANYGGAGGAAFVRDALTVYAEREL